MTPLPLSVLARRSFTITTTATATKAVVSRHSAAIIASSSTPRCFSTTGSSSEEEFTKLDPSKRNYNVTNEVPKYKYGKHRSNALELIEKQPIIEVDGNMAVCDGGGGPLGHPIEYIQLAGRAPNEWKECIYCGLKYRKKQT